MLGPRQPPPARCADGERFALEARLLRVGTGWTSVGVVVLHGGVPEADFEPDRRIATRVYDAPALCGVAWNANTGDLLHLEPGAPPCTVAPVAGASDALLSALLCLARLSDHPPSRLQLVYEGAPKPIAVVLSALADACTQQGSAGGVVLMHVADARAFELAALSAARLALSEPHT